MKFFSYLVFVLSLLSGISCSVALTEEEEDYFRNLKRSSKIANLEKAKEIDLVFMRNTFYPGPLNDLKGWRNSQELEEILFTEYFGVDDQDVEIIEEVNSAKVKSFFENYRGERLILSFSSHLLFSENIAFGDQTFLHLREFSGYLNKMKVPTLLIFNTCYAENLKKHLNNPMVSVFYTGGKRQLVYDLRISGQKYSVSKKFKGLRSFLSVNYGREQKVYTPFTLLFMNEYIFGSNLRSFSDLLNRVISENEKILEIPGIGDYSNMSFSDPADWGRLRFQ